MLKIRSRYKGTALALYLGVVGLGAGVLNGLLGAGGGIPVVFALSALLGEEIADRRDIYANALCVMLPVSVVSCVRYTLSGNLNTDGFGLYAISAILGGIAGGIFLGKLKASSLKKLFGALVIYSGIILMIR